MTPTPCTLRLARGSDIQQIAVMSRCLIEVGLRGWTWHPTRIARTLRSRETCVLVAEVDTRFAGFAITEFGTPRHTFRCSPCNPNSSAVASA